MICWLHSRGRSKSYQQRIPQATAGACELQYNSWVTRCTEISYTRALLVYWTIVGRLIATSSFDSFIKMASQFHTGRLPLCSAQQEGIPGPTRQWAPVFMSCEDGHFTSTLSLTQDQYIWLDVTLWMCLSHSSLLMPHRGPGFSWPPSLGLFDPMGGPQINHFACIP